MSSDNFSDDNTDLDPAFLFCDVNLSSSDTENNISSINDKTMII